MGLIPTWARDAVSTSHQGYTGPDPARPARLGDVGLRADAYTGHGQPRQTLDPQRSRSVMPQVLADADRPLTKGSPATFAGDRGQPGNATGTAAVLSIQAMYGAGQAGTLGNIRWGMAADSGNTFAGDLGRLQQMHGAQTVAQDMRAIGTVGNRSTFRGGMGSGLPSTSSVLGQPLSGVAAVLAQTGT